MEEAYRQIEAQFTAEKMQQWRIVRILAESPSMDFHDLAYRACILRPSLTGILTRMERDGLVLRLKPINDQRKLYISLTKEGQA
ncbi:MarR family transcriptional regulator, partial [Escherichia sp. R-CC3]